MLESKMGVDGCDSGVYLVGDCGHRKNGNIDPYLIRRTRMAESATKLVLASQGQQDRQEQTQGVASSRQADTFASSWP